MRIINNRRIFLAFKFPLLVLVFAIFHLYSGAQIAKSVHTSDPNSKNKINALAVGDKVPEITFQNVLNYKTRQAKLSDFKGKLVILDMWSISCTSCIAAFPKMEEMQKKFGDKIKILLVNPHDAKYDSEEKIKSTLEKLKKKTGYYPTLPIPLHDSILNRYFPHQSVPHQAWVNSEGIVVAITGSNEVTAANIAAVLGGSKLNIPIKDDWAFDLKKPLLLDDNGGSSGDFAFRSIFTTYKGGIGFGAGTRVNNNNEVVGYYLLNNSLRQLVMNAYSDSMDGFPKSRIIFHVNHPDKYALEFESENAYCYDLTIRPTKSNVFDSREYLKRDLKSFFNISFKKEKRVMNCYVFCTSPALEQLSSKYSDSDIDMNATTINKFFHNYSIEEIINFLEEYFAVPIIDETNISKKHIDINFPNNLNLSNTDEILKALESEGFYIKVEQRQLDVVVIRDNVID